MASAITHALVGGALGLLAAATWRTLPPRAADGPNGSGSPPDELATRLAQAADAQQRARLPWIAAALSILPDADVLMHAFVAYSHPFGHRGAFHSAAVCLLTAALVARLFASRARRVRVFLCSFAALLSHSLLDMLTNGGLGIGLLWPISAERLFFPWRPIPVSPLTVGAFFSHWGVRVLRVELAFALPLLVVAWVVHGRLRRSRHEPAQPD